MAKEARRLLVLNVDIDNDLYEKARIKGPIIGRKANVEAATKFSIADPSDTDGNAIFEAIRNYDMLKKEYQVEIATLTGSAKLGYKADMEVVRQLEKVIDDFKPDACIFVSDGASDDQIIPIVNSRIKINSVKHLVVKQTKELEKTYFVILEKLKEPHFARIVFGIPGLFFALMFLFQDIGIRIFFGLMGAYLILKGFGVEERVISRLSRTEFSLEKPSFIFNFASFAFVIISIYIAASRLGAPQTAQSNLAKLSAYFVKDLLLLFPIVLLLSLTGSIIETINQNRRYKLPNYVITATALFLLWTIANNAADWVIGTLSFRDFFLSLLFMLVVMYLVIYRDCEDET